MNYCINCMNEVPIGEEICPYCGCKTGEYTMNQRALKPLTILNGKYVVGKVLGEGGFGITYLGVDLTLNLKVAIKEFFPTQFASRNVYESGSNDIVVINGKSAVNFQRKLERYEAEARRLVKLESLPGIVRVINFFYENNTAYMVMEFISGQNLKDYKEKNRSKIHWKEALDIMKPIIKSLSVLHEKDIIHRDISPDNIMITDQNELVLIDFGTAVEIDDDERSKEIELKRGYAPPEQYSSHGDQGPWTDVYELCATLYYMISGNTLPDALAVYRKNAKIVPLKNSDHSIPATIEAAIMKGLNTDIKYRIKSMDELYEHLYDGRRIIPWRKIGLGSVITVSIIALMLIMTGIKTIYINDNMEDKDVQAQQQEITKKETETDVNEEDSNENDTASNYVKEHGLAYVEDKLITYTENDFGITITGSDYSLTDIVIPERINGKIVTSISGIGKNVTSIVFPDTLTSIENSAFKNCVYLESIYIPASVSSIGQNAFENCMSLSEIHISNGNSIFHVENGSIIDVDGNKYNIGDNVLGEQIKEIEEKEPQHDTEHYERRYGDDVYEDLMEQLDVCLYRYQFANVDDIQDAGIYFSFFYAYEHHWDDTGEQYYDPVDGYYKIPGDEIRRVLMKYMDFQELDLSEVLPGETNTMGGGSWYDAENDIYYTLILSGFDGYHSGFSNITYEILEPGVIKAVGDETITIVVREENNGVLKLISYMRSW